MNRSPTLAHKMLVAIAATTLAACATDRPIDPTFVAERWSQTLSAFNIDPVFPPRDINVGDIFLVLVPPDDAKDDPRRRYKRRAIRLATIDVREQLIRNYAARIQLPATAATNPTSNIFAAPTTIGRLPPTGYPGFNIAQVTEADIGIAFPLRIFRVLVGYRAHEQLVMSISIPSAEDYGLPANDAYDALSTFCNSMNLSSGVCLDGDRLRFFAGQIWEPGDQSMQPRIVMVTHVYYARSIEYAYSTKAGAALAANILAQANLNPQAGGPTKPAATAPGAPSKAPAKPPTPAVVETSKPPPAVTTTTTTTTTTTSAALPATTPSTADTSKASQSSPVSVSGSDGVQQELQSLHKEIEALKQQLGATAAGGTVTATFASAEGTVLRQTFPYPIAIGYRGLWIKPARPKEASQ